MITAVYAIILTAQQRLYCLHYRTKNQYFGSAEKHVYRKFYIKNTIQEKKNI